MIDKGYKAMAEKGKKRLSKMKQVKIKTPLQIASEFIKQAIKLAPEKTGETKRGIIKNKIQNGYTVKSEVPGRFKQNLWTNQSGDYLAVRMWWAKPPFRPIVYGDGTHNTTGIPMWWDRTFALIRLKAINIQKQNMQEVMKVSI